MLYAAVVISALMAADVQVLAQSAAPLSAAVETGRFASLSPIVRIGATVASLGVLLSLIVGVSRTAFAMSANRDLPVFFAAVHPRYGVPHRAEIGVGLLVVALVLLADLRTAIGFSAFTVLLYYAITNIAAWRLEDSERYRPRWISLAGLIGCIVLAFSLPLESVIGGSLVMIVGISVFVLRKYR